MDGVVEAFEDTRGFTANGTLAEINETIESAGTCCCKKVGSCTSPKANWTNEAVTTTRMLLPSATAAVSKRPHETRDH